jgi:hypothetical protein
MKENPKFEDDCCNTTFLIKILEKNPPESFYNKSLRSLAFNEKNNTIITSISSDPTKLLIFDRPNLSLVYSESNIAPIKTVGYNDGRYYLGRYYTEKKPGIIEVYDETFKSVIYTITSIDGDPLTIRFLNESQMLVGTSLSGYICERNDTTKNFKDCTPINGIENNEPVHAFGIVNQSAFYVGWTSNKITYLRLYTKYQNTWKPSENNINYGNKTSDIVIDDCKRIWIVIENENKIIIYDQNKTSSETLTIGSDKLFNLLIFENYTLVMSHETSTGLSRIRPPLNCRRPPL